MAPTLEAAELVLTIVFVAEFSSRFGAMRDRRASTSREATRDPITDIERLEALMQRGGISGEEFATKRTELLARE
jgi:hypothetical protein